ncbi:tyrosine-protein phosphatase [Paeniroseomonas aquatica]|uniref:phosphatase domain-containing putative toxin n=1 Tax=Paeniroseomonas aquatica TaxID=373043 RepID=UPI003607A88C
MLTLMEQAELAKYGVAGLGKAVKNLGMEWHHAPIRDVDIPGPAFEVCWPGAGAQLRAHLSEGRKVLLHCRGGLGRTGTIAARLLAELGVPAADAVRRIVARHVPAPSRPQSRTYALAIRAISNTTRSSP